MRQLLIVIFLIHFIADAQPYFVTTYGDQNDEIPLCIKQVGSSYFIGQKYSNDQLSIWRYAKLLKMDGSGNIQSGITFPEVFGQYSDIQCIFPLNESEFLTIGGYKSNDLPYCQIWLMKLDTSLRIIWEKKYMTNRPFTSNIALVENNEGNILIGSTLTTGDPNHLHSLFFLEITKEGDSLNSNYIINGNPQTTKMRTLNWINGQYKAFVSGFESYTGNSSASQILQLDENLLLVEVRPIPNWHDIYMTTERINNNSYFLTSMVYISPYYYDVAISKFDTIENTLAFNHAGTTGDVPDYSAWKRCMSIANVNSIYTGGTGKDNGDFYSCNESMRKVIMLSNYDSLLNCRWTCFYGSDTACYTLSTMDATSDGGCILAGMFYTPSRPENMLDVIMIKVDSLGLITGIHDKPTITAHQAIVYPNPGIDNIIIQSGPQICSSEFRLYNTSGQLVNHKILKNTNEQSDVTSLPKGVYPWKIIHQGKTIEQGKWVKQ